MREPDWQGRQTARPPVLRSRWLHRSGWLIAGGMLVVVLAGLLVVLARLMMRASVAAVVVVTTTPAISPTVSAPTSTTVPIQPLDAYIHQLSEQQQIGQLLMLSVYTDAYTSALDGSLRQAQLGSVIFFPKHNGGPLMPTTLSGLKQLI